MQRFRTKFRSSITSMLKVAPPLLYLAKVPTTEIICLPAKMQSWYRNENIFLKNQVSESPFMIYSACCVSLWFVSSRSYPRCDTQNFQMWCKMIMKWSYILVVLVLEGAPVFNIEPFKNQKLHLFEKCQTWFDYVLELR